MDWKKTAAILFCLLCGVGIVYVLFRYALGVVLPFLIAWGVALLLRPAAHRAAKYTKIPQKVCAAVLLSVSLATVVLLLWLAVNRVVFELQRLGSRLVEDRDRLGEILGSLFEYFGNLSAKIPLPDSLRETEAFQVFWQEIDARLMSMLGDALSSLSTKLPAVIASILGAMPSVLLFGAVTVIACFYFCMDTERIHAGLAGLLPASVREKLPLWRDRVRQAAVRYARAYLLILFLTFCEVFVGLSILDVEYAFLLALLTALVDILPVFGAGAVLVPWAIGMLLTKNYYIGFGLLILYGVVTLIRQIAEPKIVGGSLGLHPLLTLVSMYVGFRVFGLAGMLLGPGVVMLLRAAWPRKEEGACEKRG